MAYRVTFEDFIQLIHVLKASVLVEVEWDIDNISSWLFNQPCDSSKIKALADEGIYLANVHYTLQPREDWQMALMLAGVAGNKSKNRIFALKGTADTISPQSNINRAIDPGLMKAYRQYDRKKSKVTRSASDKYPTIR